MHSKRWVNWEMMYVNVQRKMKYSSAAEPQQKKFLDGGVPILQTQFVVQASCTNDVMVFTF